jgi:pyruvate dehydrogenase E2 component (dihydrolipoamide acetyltransferase)
VPELTMPRLSDSMEEGTILRWLVEDGTVVAKGDEIVEIETDKAAMIHEADAAGTLRIGAAEGDTLAVGAAIAQVLAAHEIAAPPPDAERTAPEPVPAAEPEPAAAASSPAPRSALGGRPRVAASSRVKASPVARRVADALGIDLAELTGSGPQGRVGRRDVEAAAAREPDGISASPLVASAPEVPVPVSEPAQAPVPAAAESVKGQTAIVELSRVQATIARRMAEAKASQPDFALTVDVEMDAAVELRARFKELGNPVVPSYNDLVVRASALALRKHPRANGAFRDGRFELYPRVNVGVAVAVADALLVPTVVDADRLSLGAIAAETRRLAAGAREGTLAAPDLSGGTFSVSNLGMFGIGQFTAVLNPPQAAILAVGALERRPVVREDAVVPGYRMTVTLTCDHRILYGADAAAFLAEIRAGLEQPLRLAL